MEATNITEVQSAIAVVADRLIFLKRTIDASNSLKTPHSPIDRVQIAQLIALLEATLAAIKAPFVDTHNAGGFFRWLRKLGKRVAEKKIESGLSEAIDQAAEAGFHLLDQLNDAPGTSDLGNIIT